MFKKLCILLTFLGFISILSSCKDQEETPETCTVVYQTTSGLVTDNQYEKGMLGLFEYSKEFEYLGLFLDEDYQEQATEDDCLKGNTLYVQQVPKEYSTEVVRLLEINSEIDTVYVDYDVSGYTTKDNKVFIKQVYPLNYMILFVDVTQFLNLEDNEFIENITSTNFYTFFFTTEHRVLYIQKDTFNTKDPQFTNLFNVNSMILSEYSIVDIQQKDEYLLFLTSNHELLITETTPDSVGEPINISSQVQPYLNGNLMKDIFFTKESNDRIVIIDDNDISYNLKERDELFELVPIVNEYEIPNEVIVEMFQEKRDIILYNDELYNFEGEWIRYYPYPEGMLNETETPVMNQLFYPGQYYLTDENLYYFHKEYDEITSSVIFSSYEELEYINISNLVPLLENERIIDIQLFNNFVEKVNQLYMMTNLGNVYVTEEFVSKLSDDAVPTHPDSDLIIHELHDIYDIDTTDSIIDMRVLGNTINIFTESGAMLNITVRSINEETVITTHVQNPVQVSVEVYTHTFFDDLSQILSDYYYNDKYRLYIDYPTITVITEDEMSSTENHTFFEKVD